MTKEQREAINHEKHRKVQERARRNNGAKFREKYLAKHATRRTEPWKALGMGRTKYYGLGLHLTEAPGQVRDDLLLLNIEKSRTCPQAAVSRTCDTGAAAAKASPALRGRTFREVTTRSYPNPATSFPVEYREAA